MYEITSGAKKTAQKILIYGPEGIGKSTFAADFPEPLFIDTEDSTVHMDVNRLPKPTSWGMLKHEVEYIIKNPDLCKTLIIDTVDWAEILCMNELCAKSQKDSIEAWGFGKGYTYLAEEFGRLLNRLSDLKERGVHIVLTAHAIMRKFEQPEEDGAYDRWELKLQKKVYPLVKEWVDMILFANYETLVISKDGKKKAKGGKRVLHTSHHACWDAKNRHGLEEKLPLEYVKITHCIPDIERSKPEPVNDKPEPADKEIEPVSEISEATTEGDIPKNLLDLMKADNISEADIRAAVAKKGYYPKETLIANYDKSFVDGVLVGAWGQVKNMIENAF